MRNPSEPVLHVAVPLSFTHDSGRPQTLIVMNDRAYTLQPIPSYLYHISRSILTRIEEQMPWVQTHPSQRSLHTNLNILVMGLEASCLVPAILEDKGIHGMWKDRSIPDYVQWWTIVSSVAMLPS